MKCYVSWRNPMWEKSSSTECAYELQEVETPNVITRVCVTQCVSSLCHSHIGAPPIPELQWWHVPYPIQSPWPDLPVHINLDLHL